jgi:hypothetical protein
MHRALAVALLACFLSAGPAHSLDQAAPTILAPLQMTISGPHLIRRGETLKFKVTLTNHSDKPVALRFPFLFDDETRFVWNITNSTGRTLPPQVYDGPPVYYCPVTGAVNDMMISVLQPGEKMNYQFAGDPSDDFVFTGKGYYHVSLKYVLAPTRNIEEARYRPLDEKPEPYTPRQKIEMLQNMPRFEATSNVWQMYLTE